MELISDRLYQSADDSIRLPAEKLAAIFGDRKVLPKMRVLLPDTTKSEAERRHALDILSWLGMKLWFLLVFNYWMNLPSNQVPSIC
jgi:hypothetical protein